MANAVPPIPFKSVMLDERGFLTPAWSGFFQELFNRIGGNTSSSNSTLASQVTLLQTQTASLQIQINDLDQGTVL